ncbi:hypothetical protein VTK73DRAFT_3670 [Phialemonium thermophilum]|uniref:Hydroxyacyl-thioester dehydratase type 2, mitochondrial n=1 Tax=Phialemonium thermophilum TaxID=223376 RepID=A0ABR3WXP2_9PEZI
MRPTRFRPGVFRPDEYLQRARQKMARLPPKPIFDVLSPMHSHLLNVSLADHIPSACQPSHFARDLLEYQARDDSARNDHDDVTVAAQGPLQDQQQPPSAEARRLAPTLRPPPPPGLPMPLGHHTVYFPPQMPASRLSPDGADRDHAPGPPFVRRLWAGGSLVFSPGWEERMRLDGRRAVCVETVGEPVVKSRGGGSRSAGAGDKVLVSVVRRYGPVPLAADEAALGFLSPDEQAVWQTMENPAIREERRLVFLRDLRESDDSSGRGAARKESRVVKAPFEPDTSFTLRPDARLLFHFSALTFNAHAIHLDPLYARDHEGHRGLLVHGPLSLTLMLSLLRSRLDGEVPSTSSSSSSSATAAGSLPRRRWHLLGLDYQNLAPLVVGEPMTVCVRRKSERDYDASDSDDGGEREARRSRWNVWIQGADGGMAVKGTAVATEMAPT